MRPFIPLIVLSILAACAAPATQEAPANVPPPTAPPATPAQGHGDTLAPPSGMVHLHALTGSGLRFDGVYGHAQGNIHYFLRFFERGNVVLIAGQQKPGDPVDLRSYLKQDAKSGQNNLHNAPVTRRNDSLFFSTMAPRGAITYAGVVDGDSVRFLKRSKATGKEAVVSYGFQPY